MTLEDNLDGRKVPLLLLFSAKLTTLVRFTGLQHPHGCILALATPTSKLAVRIYAPRSTVG